MVQTVLITWCRRLFGLDQDGARVRVLSTRAHPCNWRGNLEFSAFRQARFPPKIEQYLARFKKNSNPMNLLLKIFTLRGISYVHMKSTFVGGKDKIKRQLVRYVSSVRNIMNLSRVNLVIDYAFGEINLKIKWIDIFSLS